MAIYFIGKSALAFWRAQRINPRFDPKPSPKTYSGSTFDNAKEIENIASEVLPKNAPIEVAVGVSTSRCNTAGILRFRDPSLNVPGAYHQILPHVFVASPATTFIQLSKVLRKESLVLLGYELCGSYSISQCAEFGFEACEPVLNSDELKLLVSKFTGRNGIKLARWAANHITDGAASPMESRLAILLTLPKRSGGFGLPKPRINKTIQLPPTAKSFNKTSTLRPDFLWETQQVALEYDSALWHSSEKAYIHDSERRNLFNSLGISSISVTRDEIKNEEKMFVIVQGLHRLLGIRYRHPTQAFFKEHRKLRRNLNLSTDHG